jgi:hypothetical protein
VRKRNPQVNAVLSPHIMEELIKRAVSMDATKSEYASLVIQHWFAKGCPPVNEVEQRLLEKSRAVPK